MCMAAVFKGAEIFEQIVNNLSTKDPMWNLVKLLKRFQKRMHLNIKQFVHVYSPGAKTDNTQGTKILIVTKTFFYFNHTLQISQLVSKTFWENDFSTFSHTNIWRRKFDLAGERSKYNLRPSFEQIW